MIIIIDTNGNGCDTDIHFNGEEQKKVKEFHISIMAGRKVKMQLVKEIEGKNQLLSYYADDFKKFDEVIK